MNAMKKPLQHIHFIGVGGVGMSGIASVALDQGIAVSGSDMRQSKYTDELISEGASIFIGHDASHLSACGSLPDVVVVSTAIMEKNVEYQEALRLGIPIWHRAKMLGYLGRGKETLAVAGTHGKTTTSSMLASVIDGLGLDPTFLIGGTVRTYGTNAKSGKGKYYVVEADESDKSFTYLSPAAVLITNIEADHLDHYSDINEIYQLFGQFIDSVPESGVAVVWGGDEKLVALANKHCKRVITYGFESSCDCVISSWEQTGISSTYRVVLPSGKEITGSLKQNPGKHNILNAAGVLTMCELQNLDTSAAAKVLGEFQGVRRRFDLVGKINDITIIDDYAHHPTEIASTIAAAKLLGYNKIHVCFQPHRYTRAKLFCGVLKDEFGAAFDLADTVTFMNVYSAGETPIPGITGKTFLNTVLTHEGHPEAIYVPKRIDTVPHLMNLAKPGDLVITMGAGDVTTIGPDLLMALKAAK